MEIDPAPGRPRHTGKDIHGLTRGDQHPWIAFQKVTRPAPCMDPQVLQELERRAQRAVWRHHDIAQGRPVPPKLRRAANPGMPIGGSNNRFTELAACVMVPGPSGQVGDLAIACEPARFTERVRPQAGGASGAGKSGVVQIDGYVSRGNFSTGSDVEYSFPLPCPKIWGSE